MFVFFIVFFIGIDFFFVVRYVVKPLAAIPSLADSHLDVSLLWKEPQALHQVLRDLYSRWKAWASDHDLSAFPTSRYHFALYFAWRALMADFKMAPPICIMEAAWPSSQLAGLVIRGPGFESQLDDYMDLFLGSKLYKS